MGQHLSEPVTTKDTNGSSNSQYHCASSSMQGWRVNMEDAHTQILSLEEDKGAAFFAVFDGHGGSSVAIYGGEHLHKNILEQEEYKKGDIVAAIKKGFLVCDDDMLYDDAVKDETAGAAAISVLIKDGKMFCGNCGDSRAVASVAGCVQELSYDHKPSNEEETRRITEAGGWVEFNRVNGNLALSRALGDFAFKRNSKKSPEEQIVTANPDVIVKDILPEHEFIVLACDGIWDVLTNQEVVDFVREKISKKVTPEQICEELLQHCLAPDCQMGGIGCDNMTVIIVCLLNERPYEVLAERCSRPAQLDFLEKLESESVKNVVDTSEDSSNLQNKSEENSGSKNSDDDEIDLNLT